MAGARETGARRGEVLGIRWSDLDLDQRRMSIVHTIIEVLGVRWSDLDLDQRRMSIVHTIIDGDGAHRCRAPRAAVAATSRSTAGTVDVVRAHRRRQAEEHLAWGPACARHGPGVLPRGRDTDSAALVLAGV